MFDKYTSVKMIKVYFLNWKSVANKYISFYTFSIRKIISKDKIKHCKTWYCTRQRATLCQPQKHDLNTLWPHTSVEHKSSCIFPDLQYHKFINNFYDIINDIGIYQTITNLSKTWKFSLEQEAEQQAASKTSIR